MTSASGQDTLGILAGHELDLLLTDLVMPGMNGAELIRRATSLGSISRFLVMSGYADTALEPGTPLPPKPFTPEELLRKLQSVVRKMPHRKSSIKPAKIQLSRTATAG